MCGRVHFRGVAQWHYLYQLCFKCPYLQLNLKWAWPKQNSVYILFYIPIQISGNCIEIHYQNLLQNWDTMLLLVKTGSFMQHLIIILVWFWFPGSSMKTDEKTCTCLKLIKWLFLETAAEISCCAKYVVCMGYMKWRLCRNVTVGHF